MSHQPLILTGREQLLIQNMPPVPQSSNERYQTDQYIQYCEAIESLSQEQRKLADDAEKVNRACNENDVYHWNFYINKLAQGRSHDLPNWGRNLLVVTSKLW